MPSNHVQPSMYSTCNTYVSKAMITNADVILLLNVLPKMRQHISSYVFNPRLVHN